jgi:GNAT superfamily N-acetyltransferase
MERVRPVAAEPATHDDVEEIAALADVRRAEYELRQPLFWRRAENALDRHRAYLHGLVDAADRLFLVARHAGRLSGFVLGRLVPAPPVYEPGGLTCLVDDFAVAVPDTWPTLGLDLLHALAERARDRGVVQVVVVTGRDDEAKRKAMESAGLAVASEWWVGSIDRLAGRRPESESPEDAASG